MLWMRVGVRTRSRSRSERLVVLVRIQSIVGVFFRSRSVLVLELFDEPVELDFVLLVVVADFMEIFRGVLWVRKA